MRKWPSKETLSEFVFVEALLGGLRPLGLLMLSLLSRGEHIIIFQYDVLNVTK